MANNYTAKDATPATQTFKSTDNAGVHTPHKNIDTIAAGASADIGAVADAAVTTDTTGSLSGKLRGLVKWCAERMPAALGQTTMTASLPVVIASDQTGIPLAAGTAYIGGVKDNGPYYTPSTTTKRNTDTSTGTHYVTAAPTAGQKIVVDSLLISTLTAMTLTFTEETSGTVIFEFFLAANAAPIFLDFKNGRKLDTADKRLIVASSSSTTSLFITCNYHSEA